MFSYKNIINDFRFNFLQQLSTAFSRFTIFMQNILALSVLFENISLYLRTQINNQGREP